MHRSAERPGGTDSIPQQEVLGHVGICRRSVASHDAAGNGRTGPWPAHRREPLPRSRFRQSSDLRRHLKLRRRNLPAWVFPPGAAEHHPGFRDIATALHAGQQAVAKRVEHNRRANRPEHCPEHRAEQRPKGPSECDLHDAAQYHECLVFQLLYSRMELGHAAKAADKSGHPLGAPFDAEINTDLARSAVEERKYHTFATSVAIM